MGNKKIVKEMQNHKQFEHLVLITPAMNKKFLIFNNHQIKKHIGDISLKFCRHT